MLGPWSMAARLQGCHCRGCFRPAKIKYLQARRRLTTTTTAAKRATGTAAVNSRRRKVLASDVFTACYVAIMATAAVIDAGWKDERRQRLDRKIEVTKHNLHCIMAEAAKVGHRGNSQGLIPDPFQDSTKTSFEVLEDICKRARPGWLLNQEPKLEENWNELVWLRKSVSGIMMRGQGLRPPLETGMTTLSTVTETLLSEEAEAKGALTVGREPATEVQMERMTAMVNKLVDELLMVAYTKSEAEAPYTNPPPESLDSAHTLIRLLRSDGHPRFTFPELRGDDAVSMRSKMDDLNRKIMIEFLPQFRVRQVAKICYNLLVCEFPPSVQNYNTLIWGFTEIGENELAWVVVESFLFHGHLQPTKGTVLSLLAHFRLKRDVVGFFDTIKRMIGQDVRGIGLGRKRTEDRAGVKALLYRAGAENVVFSEGYYVQIMKLDRTFIEAIAEGLLDFGFIPQAAKLLVSCLREGWMVNPEMLNRFFHGCIDHMDHLAARTIVEGLLAHIGQATTLIDQLRTSVVRNIRRVLAIWHVKSPFTIEDRLTHSGWDEPPTDNFEYLTTALWLKETTATTRRTNHAIERAIKALENKHNPLHLRLDLATSIIEHATKLQQLDSERTANVMWMAKIHYVHDQVDETEALITAGEYMLVNAFTKVATPKGMRTWMHFKKKVPIATRMQFHKDALTRDNWLNEVAYCFAVKRELDFQLKCILFQALPDEWVDSLWKMRNSHDDISLDTTMIYTAKWLKKLRGFTWQSRDAYSRGEIEYGELLQHNNINRDEELAELRSRGAGAGAGGAGMAGVKAGLSRFPRLPEPMVFDDTEEKESEEGESGKKNKNNKKKKKKKEGEKFELELVMDPEAFNAQMMAGLGGGIPAAAVVDEPER
ncbi:hypothetical protein QBC44DRAFT_358938 [Cladorrhinum sp. PSN332]|nr:hypothetical protein QBC44DRAFT_358938 [Cladorrhinum sp. PSN332]